MATLNPYLGFRDNAREAITFYQAVFGGELTIMTFSELGLSEDASESEKIGHSQLETPSGFTLMAADTLETTPYTAGDNFTISISGSAVEETELRGYWDALVNGGTVTAPLALAPWGDLFGQCTDKYGVQWLINATGPNG